MELYIQVAFWIHLIAVGVRAVNICVCTYPRVEKNSIGADMITLLLGIGFATWAGFLLYAS